MSYRITNGRLINKQEEVCHDHINGYLLIHDICVGLDNFKVNVVPDQVENFPVFKGKNGWFPLNLLVFEEAVVDLKDIQWGDEPLRLEGESVDQFGINLHSLLFSSAYYSDPIEKDKIVFTYLSYEIEVEDESKGNDRPTSE